MELNVDPTIVVDVGTPIEDTAQNDGAIRGRVSPEDDQS
jgi:hypothetical protein